MRRDKAVDKAVESSGRFWRIASAGVLFQGGAAAVDTSTIIAALVHGLTGSLFAVGAAAAIARTGWLVPQVIVGYLAQRRRRRLGFYAVGALGRVACLAGVAVLVAGVGDRPGPAALAAFFALWTAYAFVSGIVAVPYNDIVARSIPSARRSRMLAIRFFGGGVLALIVALLAARLIDGLPFPRGHAGVVGIGAMLLLGSALCFMSAGEQDAALPVEPDRGFGAYLRAGIDVFGSDRRLRLFVYTQWLGGGVAMALPFYILQPGVAADGASNVALLLAAQTAGALLSNPLWGWWGDVRGKRSLLQTVAVAGAFAPLLTLAWLASGDTRSALAWFALVFALLGAVGSGGTIAQLGYLMEISPDTRRPAYSGYFNALVAPAALLPLAGAAIAMLLPVSAVFSLSALAAVLQVVAIRRMHDDNIAAPR